MTNKVFTVVAAAVLASALFAAGAWAALLTASQENLAGLPNVFALKVSDFPEDGGFSPQGVKALAEEVLTGSGLALVPEGSPPPLAVININVATARSSGGDGNDYLLDVNLYSLEVIQTKYKLRKGTIWHIGSRRVKPAGEFPKDVEGKIRDMLKELIHDYAAANPGVGKLKGDR